MTEIAGKAALVTGGGSGIGMALAKALAKEGASVALADIRLDNAREVADEIVAEGGRAVAIQCDVCERGDIARMKAEANAAVGRIELLFSNAGASSFVPVVEMDDREIEWMIQVNLMAGIWITKAFLADMIEARSGHIIVSSSMAGLTPAHIPIHAPYCAAKMGLIGYVMNLQREIDEFNIKTTIYCSGGVVGGMRLHNNSYRPEKFGGPTDAKMKIPKASFEKNPIKFYWPEGVAPMVLTAVRNDRPFVFDHSEQREDFRKTYSDIVEACFDDTLRYEQEVGIPPSVN
ncbi:SDR family NAD(P)-dependent oxidoreductase [Sphingomonas tabacisoli]|uniref:SDR family NAD(P)-dependent oxidoreductase n=1 Tax=Sphingomonas tabacisoli TaxID=2249466 RepID=A0ABW4I3V0_9SPHN